MAKLLSKSVDLDFVYRLADKNPSEAVKLLVLYLKLQEHGTGGVKREVSKE